MILDVSDAETLQLIDRYIERLSLPTENLQITTERATFQSWLGRRVSGGIGGAYVFLTNQATHAIFINLARIDRSQSHALEVVVAEELIHMQDHLAGDRRRHAKHGHDRIAHRVAEVTGATLEEIRSCLLPRQARPYRYIYSCARCGVQIPRRVRGRWACGPCYERSRRRYPLTLTAIREPTQAAGTAPGDERPQGA